MAARSPRRVAVRRRVARSALAVSVPVASVGAVDSFGIRSSNSQAEKTREAAQNTGVPVFRALAGRQAQAIAVELMVVRHGGYGQSQTGVGPKYFLARVVIT